MALPQSSLLAQTNLRIYEDIGGGSGTTSTSGDSDNSFVYIAGGLLVVGVLAYALFIKKDKKSEVTDSTQALNILNPTGNEFYSSNIEKEITGAKDRFPVDILLGIKREDVFISDKTYIMGVSVRF
jgi:hypothetical protein